MLQRKERFCCLLTRSRLEESIREYMYAPWIHAWRCSALPACNRSARKQRKEQLQTSATLLACNRSARKQRKEQLQTSATEERTALLVAESPFKKKQENRWCYCKPFIVTTRAYVRHGSMHDDVVLAFLLACLLTRSNLQCRKVSQVLAIFPSAWTC